MDFYLIGLDRRLFLEQVSRCEVRTAFQLLAYETQWRGTETITGDFNV
jgi:hypothetical protein